MTWNDLALNPSVILAQYPVPPDLEAVEVHSLLFHRDGPTLEMTIELPTFPDKPSHGSDCSAMQPRRNSASLV